MAIAQIVILSLEGNQFGIRMDSVNAIERLPELCKVPGLPAYVEGLAEIGGKVHTIVNLRKRLGLSEKASDEETRVILLEACSSLIGLVVDSVREIVEADTQNINEGFDAAQLPPVIKDGNLVKGMLNLPGRTVLILNLDSLI